MLPAALEPPDLHVAVQVRTHRDELLLNGGVLDLVAEVRLAKVPADAQRLGHGSEPEEEARRSIGLARVGALPIPHTKQQIALRPAVLGQRPGPARRIGVARGAPGIAVTDHPRISARARSRRHERKAEREAQGPADWTTNSHRRSLEDRRAGPASPQAPAT